MGKRRVVIEADSAPRTPPKGGGRKKRLAGSQRRHLHPRSPARCVSCGWPVMRRVGLKPSDLKPCPQCGGREFEVRHTAPPSGEPIESRPLTAPNPRRLPGSYGSRSGG